MYVGKACILISNCKKKIIDGFGKGEVGLTENWLERERGGVYKWTENKSLGDGDRSHLLEGYGFKDPCLHVPGLNGSTWR